VAGLIEAGEGFLAVVSVFPLAYTENLSVALPYLFFGGLYATVEGASRGLTSVGSKYRSNLPVSLISNGLKGAKALPNAVGEYFSGVYHDVVEKHEEKEKGK
jgi:hypothetical protein